MSPFAPKSSTDIVRLVREHPLAMLVSNGDAGFSATPLPLVAEIGENGDIVALVGHFARSNPHLADLRRGPEAVAIFQGPQGYISPRMVSKPGWGPTWNYAVARFQLSIELTPERNDQALALLAKVLEGDGPDAWTPRRMGDRYDQLAQHIVAFRATVLGIHATFKLGQDEDDKTFAEIVESLGDSELARMMLDQRTE